MDATATALRQPLRFPATAAASPSSSKESRNSSGLVRLRRRGVKNGVFSSGFCDRGHLQYYKSSFDSAAATAEGRRMSVMSGMEVKTGKEEKSLKKMKKKQLKLLKGLSKDLSTFSQMGFGLDSAAPLLDQIKGNMISEATQLLLEQLQKVKAEEKEQKKRMKEEKARMKAAARMQIGANCEMSSSSSSSSESSDSECGEVVDMTSLKRATSVKTGLQQVIEETVSAYPPPIIPTIPSLNDTDPAPLSPSLALPKEELKLQLASSSNVQNADSLCAMNGSSFVAQTGSKKIEVCMGGKCKKSGAGALLEEFQRAVGIEGAVSGCKCMGKCRDGPNVKVVNAVSDEVVTPTAATTMTATKSLCIGVGLEDVNVIVQRFMDGHQYHNQQQQLGFGAA